MPYLHSHFHYHLPRMKEMGRVYWTHGIGALGVSIAMIFVPIFLLQSGYSFQAVLLYLFAQHGFAALMQVPMGRLFAYIKPHHLMALGVFWQVVFFALLGTMGEYNWPLWLLAFVWALNRNSYWPAFHYVFAVSRAHKKAGVQVAGLQSILMTATTLAPAVGGVIATSFDITVTYLIATLLMLIAILPMLSSHAGPPKAKLTFSKAEFKKIRPDLMANIFEGMVVGTEKAIWPLLVFAVVASYAGVGILSSVIAIASIAIALFVGKRERTRGERHYIKQGMLTYSLTSIGRTLVQNAMQVFGANLFAGIGRSLYITPFLSRYYSNSDGPSRLGYIIAMDMSFSVGMSLYLAALFVLSLMLSMYTVLVIGVASAAFTILGLRLMR